MEGVGTSVGKGWICMKGLRGWVGVLQGAQASTGGLPGEDSAIRPNPRAAAKGNGSLADAGAPGKQVLWPQCGHVEDPLADRNL